MLSNYEIVKVADPPRTLRILATALGPIAVVEKVRTLMMRDNVRLHLDQVARLGDYGEIEAVIADGDDPERSRGAVNEILAALGRDAVRSNRRVVLRDAREALHTGREIIGRRVTLRDTCAT